jgi:hypothetical protein
MDKKLPASQMMDETLTENQLELLLYLTARLLLIVADCLAGDKNTATRLTRCPGCAARTNYIRAPNNETY